MSSPLLKPREAYLASEGFHVPLVPGAVGLRLAWTSFYDGYT